MGVKDADIRIARGGGQWRARDDGQNPSSPASIGSDDGVVSVSKTGRRGRTSRRTCRVSEGGWVSEVVPSRFDAGTVYVTVDAHRSTTTHHIWVSRDFGDVPLNANLSREVIRR